MSGDFVEHLEGFRLGLDDAGFACEQSNPIERWNGDVRVDWLDDVTGQRKSATHHISVVLPVGFPYHAPIVLSRDDPPLADSWHLSPKPYRSLCLWNAETGWKPYFTARQLLRRVEEWFSHYHTDSWPPGSEMPDLHLYLESKGMVIFGDDWSPQIGETSGKFVLWGHEKGIAFSLYVVSLPDREPEQRIVSRLLLNLQHSNKHVGVWFRLQKPFVPPDNLRDLLRRIDESLNLEDYGRGVCTRTYGYQLALSGFPIAIGYTDRTNEERWLFLWADIPLKRRKKRKVNWADRGNLSEIQLKSFQTAPARKKDILRRSVYLSRHLDLHKVAVFGLGALGGHVAMLLAKAGVGEMRLIDDDKILPGNVIRHICGLSRVGIEKTWAVRYSILDHFPDCKVETFTSSWTADKLREYIDGCSAVVDATANYNFSLLLNEVCISARQPVVFSTTYRRASIGRIVIRRHEDDPCLACYVDPARDWSDNTFPLIPTDPDQMFVDEGCNSVTEEAVALDVESIANLTARLTVKLIRKQLDGINLAIAVNEPIADSQGVLTHPGIHLRQNQPLANCAICRE